VRSLDACVGEVHTELKIDLKQVIRHSRLKLDRVILRIPVKKNGLYNYRAGGREAVDQDIVLAAILLEGAGLQGQCRLQLVPPRQQQERARWENVAAQRLQLDDAAAADP
jgi:hypothetical protein